MFFFSFLSFFFQLIRSISEFGAKKHFIDHRTANAIHLSVIIKSIFWGYLLFQNISQRGGIPQGLLDRCSHLYLHIIKMNISSGQKPAYIVKILISEQIVITAALYFGQVFIFRRLIKLRVLEWFLLIMCK